MKKKYWILLTTAPAVLVLDQVTKWVIANTMELGQRFPVIPGFFDIVYFHNQGAAFGMFSGLSDSVRTPFFYVVAVIATALLAMLYRTLRDDENLVAFAIALVFGGIVGNIVDRLRYDSVVDFLSLHVGDTVVQGKILGIGYRFPLEWPAFNVADSAISVAMVILILTAFVRRHRSYGGEE